VKSTAQSGRMRTLIHPGPVSGVHVKWSYVLGFLTTADAIGPFRATG